MPKVDPKTLAQSIARAAEQNGHTDAAPQRHRNKPLQNYTTNSPKRQQDAPGPFGRHAVNWTHAAPKTERVYAAGIETTTKPNGQVVRVKDASDKRWDAIAKQVIKGDKRITVR